MPIDDLLRDLDERIEHQQTWRRVMSGAYFATTGMAIAASGAATVVAGLGYAAEAAVLAGAATILFGLEKALLFREKWSHHLRTVAELDSVKLALRYGNLEPQVAARRMSAILSRYATDLPMADRDITEPEEQRPRQPA